MPVLLVLAAAVLWALIGPISKYAFNEGVSPLETAFWRSVFASAFLLAHAAFARKLRVRARDFAVLAGFGVFGVALLEGSYVLAIESGGVAFASILLYSAPIWVAIASVVLHGSGWAPARVLLEHGRLGGAKILALAVALTGVFGVVLQGAEGGLGFSGTALFWGLLSGLSYASFYLFGKIFLSRLDPITLLAWAFSVASLALLPFVPFTPKSQVAWTSLLALGFLSTYLAYFVYYLGLRRIEATRASVIASIEPVVATFLAWWLWNERLSALGYFWAAWVVGGIALMVKAK